MTDAEADAKARKWSRDDAPCCLACEKEFKPGDRVHPLGGACIHAGCRRLYVRQCKELGVTP